MFESSFPTFVVRNLGRRPLRTAILVVCVAAVVGMQVAAALLDISSRKGIERGLERLGADLVVVPRGFEDSMLESLMSGQVAPFYMDAAIEEEIATLHFVEKTTTQLFIQSLTGASCCSMWSVFLIGFESESDFAVRPWLSRNARPTLQKGDILVGAAIDAEQGEELKFYGRQFRVAGVLDPSGTGLDTTIFIPLSTMRSMADESSSLKISKRDISAVLVKLKSNFRRGLPTLRAAKEIENLRPDVGVILPDDMLLKTRHNLSGTLSALRSASFAIWPVTVLLIGLVFTMSTTERQREIGLLRAMGATPSYVFHMIVLEALVITAVGTVLGLTLTSGIIVGFSEVIALELAIPFYWPHTGDLVGIYGLASVLSLFSGTLAALYPAVMASRQEPYEAIRRSEQ